MKKLMMIMVLGALVACLVPANAQDWKSTSSMPVSGSTLAPQVTTVGATTVAQQATTTANYTPVTTSGPRRGYDANGNWTPDSEDFGGGVETGESNQFPIGDAVLPLLLMALGFCGVIALRKRRV